MRTRDLLKLKNFIAWLAEQPEDQEYDYVNHMDCPIVRYIKAMRPEIDWIMCSSSKITYTTPTSKKWIEYVTPYEFEQTVIGHPRTFGAAHDRARALLTEKR